VHVCVEAIKNQIIFSLKRRRFLPWQSKHIGYIEADKTECGLALPSGGEVTQIKISK